MTFYETLKSLGLPMAYSHFGEDQKAPFLVYLGGGQEQFKADNSVYKKQNTYQVELYFTRKDETIEEALENVLDDNGYFWDKSADVWIQDQKVSVIYYEIEKKGW